MLEQGTGSWLDPRSPLLAASPGPVSRTIYRARSPAAPSSRGWRAQPMSATRRLVGGGHTRCHRSDTSGTAPLREALVLRPVTGVGIIRAHLGVTAVAACSHTAYLPAATWS
jgi:hypothetical protein